MILGHSHYDQEEPNSKPQNDLDSMEEAHRKSGAGQFKKRFEARLPSSLAGSQTFAHPQLSHKASRKRAAIRRTIGWELENPPLVAFLTQFDYAAEDAAVAGANTNEL